ncbi:hypothetical protein DYO40_21825 [Salmonella enterica subsp. enterica serovar Javiana]|nr:hypothetical protein [Salmonella enterica subsp. enterica serovar Javiana]ECV1375373.1 hypothetical protein [Salmonella enterica subsp. enterica serovar Javiana]
MKYLRTLVALWVGMCATSGSAHADTITLGGQETSAEFLTHFRFTDLKAGESMRVQARCLEKNEATGSVKWLRPYEYTIGVDNSNENWEIKGPGWYEDMLIWDLKPDKDTWGNTQPRVKVKCKIKNGYAVQSHVLVNFAFSSGSLGEWWGSGRPKSQCWLITEHPSMCLEEVRNPRKEWSASYPGYLKLKRGESANLLYNVTGNTPAAVALSYSTEIRDHLSCTRSDGSSSIDSVDAGVTIVCSAKNTAPIGETTGTINMSLSLY